MRRLELPQFTEDVADEVAYLAVHASEDVARRWHRSVLQTLEIIADNPGRGHPREDLEPEGIRCLSVRGFRRWLVFYRVVGPSVHFLRVKHGSMHLPALFPPEL